MDDFEQILAFWASVDDLIEWMFARTSADAAKDSTVCSCRIWVFQWKSHGRILGCIILIQYFQSFQSGSAIQK